MTIENIISCTTDNCSTMIATARHLNIWRIPCVIHVLNLIFKTFIDNCYDLLEPFFHLVNYLTRSTKYSLFVNKENIRKVPAYVSTRWTSFCETVLTLLSTKDELIQFCQFVDESSPSDHDWERLSLIQNLCNDYKMVVNFFEADQFGASGFFLIYMDLIYDRFKELEKTDFGNAANMAIGKINKLKDDHSYFWQTIATIALLLNHSVPFDLLLTSEEITKAKNSIISQMKKYESKNIEISSTHPTFLDKYYVKTHSPKKAPLEKVLDERNLEHSPEALKKFWFAKINTIERPLALVAIDLLGIIVTSVSSERSFSRGRLVINDQRTRISSDHAKQQMILQLNKETAKIAISRLNLI